ncbi:HAD-IA family hydrolase [Pseudoalteromonas sp. APAL1]|mgnify:FL=1|jgi:HAD superfamily hydrolase (TIGR01549 family)|uniref:HAD-IA family hydrolase n=1 Tax=Pseudoalteromonas TaxID=53246 RepID=UPI000EDAB59E|nr:MULTISPECIES: HAD-IA family hydrolase [unclassified Pseudoalteromonas]MCF2918988.1 HAD-IA family hydrolase [Pseudoalteromonas sp. APAL1]HCV04866.1 hypothetical protein [Pseudoalteromonas sp.]|tara:strand:- start:6855 stop:9167 length:2313 start_codon:yes stop_codon:yes gene_type:complete
MNLHDLYLNSEISAEIDLIFKNKEVKVVSFDIFDTLLRRKCGAPTDIFTLVAKTAIERNIPIKSDPETFRNSRIFFEKKARLQSPYQDITLPEIYACSPYTESVQLSLIEIEHEVEAKYLYPDPICKEVIQHLFKYNVEFIATSDMYLSNSFLSKLLRTNFPEVNFTHIFVSSETRLTKASGDMYSHLLDQLNISQEQIIHIGDNLKSDVINASAAKIKSLHFAPPRWIQRVLSREKIFKDFYPNEINQARIFAAMLAPSFLSFEEKLAFLIGAVIHGPTLAGFAKWIKDQCEHNEISHPLFLMREGEIYKHVFDFFFQEAGVFSTRKFYASRKATYLPSIDPKELSRDISQVLTRKNYCVKNLLTDLQLPYEKDDSLQSILDEEVNKISNDKVKVQLINAFLEKHREQLTLSIKQKQTLLDLYIEQVTKNEDYAFVDFGAGGTINHQIEKSTTKSAKLNILFYTTERAYNHANELIFMSFLPFVTSTFTDVMAISRSPEIVEYFLVGKNTTTLDFTIENEKVVPICAKDTSPEKHKQLVTAFNFGVDSYLYFSKSLNLNEHTYNNRLAAVTSIARQVRFPTEIEAKFLGNLKHEDNFGSESQYSIIEQNEIDEIRNIGLNEFWSNHLTFKGLLSKRVTWPQGLITRLDPLFLSKNVFFHNETESKHQESIMTIHEQLKELKLTEVVVYGAGEFFDELELLLKSLSIRIVHLVDKKAEFGNYSKRGFNVISPTQASNLNLPVVVASESFLDEIQKHIENLNISNGVIIKC